MAGIESAVDPPPLPIPSPRLAHRQQFVTAEGAQIDLLVAGDNSTCYRFVRSLANALMGKVKSAVVCEYEPSTASWAVPTPYIMVAVKQLYKICVERHVTTDGKPVKENPLGEVAMLHHLSTPGHPNVMRLLDFLEDDRCYYVVLELLSGGELFDQVQELGKVPEAAARRYMWQTVHGASYLHAMGVTHRDLSLENAMRQQPRPDSTVKLIDFGLAVRMPHLPTLLRNDGRVGKEKYMAPETYAGSAYDGRAIDVWCQGMMMFVLLFGIYPYSIPSPKLCPYFKEIEAGKLLSLLTAWNMTSHVSSEALDLVNRMLTADVARRITLDDVIAHPWFAGMEPPALPLPRGVGAASSVDMDDRGDDVAGGAGSGAYGEGDEGVGSGGTFSLATVYGSGMGVVAGGSRKHASGAAGGGGGGGGDVEDEDMGR